eukprot:14277415-Ditylum_brightwellii.AAC.1
MQLNEGANKFTALVNLPSSNIVRLVHGLGFGTSAIGSTSQQVNCPTDTRLQEHLQQNANPSAWHRFLTSRILSEEKETVMQITAIPAFL